MASYRKRLDEDDDRFPPSSKRHHYTNRSSSPTHRPSAITADLRPLSFPTFLDIPNLSSKIHRLCEIIASSSPSSIESSLDDSSIRISTDEVEEVLKLSYSHPAAAVKFFRWSGFRLHHHHSPYSWNLVVDLLGKNLLFNAMWDTVTSMKSKGIVSLATFASIFSSFATARYPAEAILAFESLPQFGVLQDATALNSLLSALTREGFTSAALDFIHRIHARIKPDSDSYAILLEGFENERNHRSSIEVFDEMILRIGWDPSNTPAYNSFLNTVLSHPDGGLDEALRWVAKMKENQCSPGEKFVINAIDCCAKLHDCRLAVLLWSSLIGGDECPRNTELYNSMISLYCNLNQLDPAYTFFDEMVIYGVFPDSKTYTLMLNLLIKNKKSQEASVLLSEMMKNEHSPSPSVCDSLMNLLIESKDRETAVEVWKMMMEYEIAGEEIGNLLICCLTHYTTLPEACKFAEDMIDRGMKLQSATLTKLRKRLQQINKQYKYDEILSKWKTTAKCLSL